MLILTFLHNDSQVGGLAADTHTTCMKIALQEDFFYSAMLRYVSSFPSP